jgi:protein-tyrosine sulfotransferase
MIRYRFIKYFIAIIFFYYLIYYFYYGDSDLCNSSSRQRKVGLANENGGHQVKKVFSYNKNVPLVFISGIPGSGLDLMKSFLNGHDKITCSEEKADLISNLIIKRNEWTNSKIEKERLKYAGMTDEVIDSAITSFMLEIVMRQQLNLEGKLFGEKICQSNSYIIKHIDYIKNLLPNVKFIFMIKDPRSTVTYLINKHIEYNGISTKTFKQAIMDWNRMTKDVYYYCMVSKSLCLPVLYEELILKPSSTMKKVFKFLNVEQLNQTQINHILNVNNINNRNFNELFNWWRPYFPASALSQLKNLAPYMSALGYDPINTTFNFTFHDRNFDDSIDSNNKDLFFK